MFLRDVLHGHSLNKQVSGFVGSLPDIATYQDTG